jgi:hypothetical protein
VIEGHHRNWKVDYERSLLGTDPKMIKDYHRIRNLRQTGSSHK